MPIVKRYANRKLYNLDDRRYVTLDDIAGMIRSGTEVRVIDHESEEDITPLIQAQIISREELQEKRGLPTAVLTNLIQAGSSRLHWLQDTLAADGANARIDAEIERRVRLLIARGDLKNAQGERLLAKLLAVGQVQAHPRPGEHAGETPLNKLGIASHQELAALERQVEALTAELNRLNNHKPRHAVKKD